MENANLPYLKEIDDIWMHYIIGSRFLLLVIPFAFNMMCFTIYTSYSPLYVGEDFSIISIALFIVLSGAFSFIFDKLLEPKYLKKDSDHILDKKKHETLTRHNLLLPIVPTFFCLVTFVITPEDNYSATAMGMRIMILPVMGIIIMSLVFTVKALLMVQAVNHEKASDADV